MSDDQSKQTATLTNQYSRPLLCQQYRYNPLNCLSQPFVTTNCFNINQPSINYYGIHGFAANQQQQMMHILQLQQQQQHFIQHSDLQRQNMNLMIQQQHQTTIRQQLGQQHLFQQQQQQTIQEQQQILIHQQQQHLIQQQQQHIVQTPSVIQNITNNTYNINNGNIYNGNVHIDNNKIKNGPQSINTDKQHQFNINKVFDQEEKTNYNMYSDPPVSPIILPNLCPPTNDKTECYACREHVMIKHHIPIRSCVECSKYYCDACKPGNTCEFCVVVNNDHQNHGDPVILRNYYQYPTPTAFFEDANGIKWSKNKGLGENQQDLDPIENEIFSKGFTTKDNFYQFQLFTEVINTPWNYTMIQKDYHYNQTFFDFNTFNSIYQHDSAMVDLLERRWIKPMKFIINHQKDKKTIMDSVLASIEPWNAKEIVCTFSGNSKKPKRVALSTPISWRVENKKKQFIDTTRDINDLFDEDDKKLFNKFTERLEWTICQGLKLNEFHFGRDLITNSNGYVTDGSLLSHQDYKEFDSHAIAITHINHVINNNSKWSDLEQTKKFAFSGFMHRPQYQGMVVTTEPGVTCTMGTISGTEWYHMVPVIRSKFDATLQHRKWIGEWPK